MRVGHLGCGTGYLDLSGCVRCAPEAESGVPLGVFESECRNQVHLTVRTSAAPQGRVPPPACD